MEPSAHRWEHTVIKTPQVNILGWQMAAAGYTGVWATENTRESIWDALKRLEEPLLNSSCGGLSSSAPTA